MKRTILFLVLCLAGAGISEAAENPGRKIYVTKHVNPHVPEPDGKLDEPAWDKVPWEGGFIQREPYEGAAPTEQTSFKILYDDKNLYIGIRAHDSKPGGIDRRMSRRDDIDGDWVEISLDSFYDRRTAFCFAVNAAGVKRDLMIINDSGWEEDQDLSWDPIWEVETALDGDGWTAEMRIPFSQIRFANRPEHVWGLQIARRLFRTNERSNWQPIPKNAPGWVSLFGELRGLNGIRPPHQVEILPYAVGKLHAFRGEAGNPFATGRSRTLWGGLDGKAGITGDLTLNFTVNPDFGQVEADPSVVNLTAFETYYEEKRPFFVEGRNILDFQLTGGDGDMSSDNLFYTRRIGRPPQSNPDVAGFAERPEATAILGALKLTGKTQSGLSVGMVESVTAEERARVFSGGGYDSLALEPLTNYFGLRLQKDFNGGGTTVGGMVTAVSRRLDDDRLSFLHDAAYAGGFDLYHSWKNKTYYASFKGIFSYVHGTSEALLRTQKSSLRYYQRPDADHVVLDPARTSLFGHGGTIDLGKRGGGSWMYSTGVTWRSPGLELNDMGYLRSADQIMQWIWAGHRIYKPFSVFRSLGVNFNEWMGWDFGGTNSFGGGNINLNAQFKNYWEGGFGLNRNLSGLSASMLRGGPSVRFPGAMNLWWWVETDMRRKVRLEFSGSVFRRDTGEYRESSVEAGIIATPSKALSLRLLPSFIARVNELQYIGTFDKTGGVRYVFGRIEQKTAALTVRLNYSVTPDLTVQLYGQPFVSAGKYSRFKRIINPKTKVWEDRYRLFDQGQLSLGAGTYRVDEDGDGAADYGFGNPDFNFLEFRSNLVIRWEYVPGSTVYLVWSQGRTGLGTMGDFSFGRDFSGLFDVHPENVLLLKFSYCFEL